MLRLKRGDGERIAMILPDGGWIWLKVIMPVGSIMRRATIEIEAPESVKIWREELIDDVVDGGESGDPLSVR